MTYTRQRHSTRPRQREHARGQDTQCGTHRHKPWQRRTPARPRSPWRLHTPCPPHTGGSQPRRPRLHSPRRSRPHPTHRSRDPRNTPRSTCRQTAGSPPHTAVWTGLVGTARPAPSPGAPSAQCGSGTVDPAGCSTPPRRSTGGTTRSTPRPRCRRRRRGTRRGRGSC